MLSKLWWYGNVELWLVGLSGRTIRDWRREKFKPTKEHIFKMGHLAKIVLPKYTTPITEPVESVE